MRYFADYIKGKPYQKTVLWVNPAPTSNFSDQTITLSDNMNNYDEIEVIYRTSTSLADNLSIKMLMSEFVKTAFETVVGVGRLPALAQPASNQLFTRLIARVSDTSIRITDAFRVNVASSSSAYCIPLKIIGIKKGLGETKKFTLDSILSFNLSSAYTVPKDFDKVILQTESGYNTDYFHNGNLKLNGETFSEDYETIFVTGMGSSYCINCYIDDGLKQGDVITKSTGGFQIVLLGFNYDQ